MWIFLSGALRIDAFPSVEFLETLIQCAQYRLRCYSDIDDLEIVCEAASLISLSSVYRADHQGNNTQIDQWLSPFWQPDISRAGMDCEDGTEATLRILWALSQSTSLGQSIIGNNQYELMFAIVTLELDTKECAYHAVVIGLDQEWFQDWIHNGHASSRIPLHRSFLIESTAYTTSVTNGSRAANIYSKRWIPENNNVGCKLGSQNHRYHHILTIFNPQWIEKYNGKAEYQFYNLETKCIGLPVDALRDYRISSSIQLRSGPSISSSTIHLINTILWPRFPSPIWPDLKCMISSSGSTSSKGLLYYVRNKCENMEEIIKDAKKHHVNEITIINSLGLTEFMFLKE